MARSAMALVLAAVIAVAAAGPTVTTNLAANTLAKGLVKKLTSTGGSLKFVSGSASILGNFLTYPSVNANYQIGYFTDASATLVDSTGKGIILTAGPASNMQTGSAATFTGTTKSVTKEIDPLFSQTVMGDGNTYSSWVNSVGISFQVTLPAGNLTGLYGFCTERPTSAYSNSFDLAIVSINSTSQSFPATNILLYNGVTASTNEISVYTRFSSDGDSDNGGQAGTTYGLSSNITRCLGSQYYTVVIPTAGTYTIQYSVANQGNVVVSGRSTQAFLFTGGVVVTDYPDIYNPNVTNSLFTGTDDVNSVDTYCMFGSSSANDLTPGYRVEGVSAGSSSKFCCRIIGHINTTSSQCEINTCGKRTSYTAFVKSSNVYRDCYAECYERTAYIGNDPYTVLGTAMTALYDNRTDTVALYSGAAVTSGVTITDGLVYAGTNPQRTFAFRHGVVVLSDTSSTTGILITSGATTYICQKRGAMSAPGSCTIGCSEITTGFLSVGNTAGDRCFTGCYAIV